MPHQCVRCNKFHDDGAKELLAGCACGARMFFYIKKERLDSENVRKVAALTGEQRIQIEQDLHALLGTQQEEPVVLDIESINVVRPGTYEIDVVSLFQGRPVIFKIEEGKYVIDLPQMFRQKDSRR